MGNDSVDLQIVSIDIGRNIGDTKEDVATDAQMQNDVDGGVVGSANINFMQDEMHGADVEVVDSTAIQMSGSTKTTVMLTADEVGNTVRVKYVPRNWNKLSVKDVFSLGRKKLEEIGIDSDIPQQAWRCAVLEICRSAGRSF